MGFFLSKPYMSSRCTYLKLGTNALWCPKLFPKRRDLTCVSHFIESLGEENHQTSDVKAGC